MPRIVYSSKYRPRLALVDRWHDYDSRRPERLWAEVRSRLGTTMDPYLAAPPRAARMEELAEILAPKYVRRLGRRKYLAQALDLAPLFPVSLLQTMVLKPMRWACMGTLVAAREALTAGTAVNLSGGFHQARPDHGEALNIFNDLAFAIHNLRKEGALSHTDTVVTIDLAANLGNGVAHHFMEDERVAMFDMYNNALAPADDVHAVKRINAAVPLLQGCPEFRYLRLLKSELPRFLEGKSPALALFVAGTDIHREDPHGGLDVGTKGVLERDRFVMEELHRREIPVCMVVPGGYWNRGHELSAESVVRLFQEALQEKEAA